MKIYAPTARAARRVECPRSDTAPDSAPANFDPASHPIIARHFFGVEPLRPIGVVAAVVVADLKRLRQVEYLHRLGPRAIGEMLREVANGEDLDRALEGGEEAAQAAARRFIAEGRKVKIARPPRGLDFNDLLLKPENVVPFTAKMEAAHG